MPAPPFPKYDPSSEGQTDVASKSLWEGFQRSVKGAMNYGMDPMTATGLGSGLALGGFRFEGMGDKLLSIPLWTERFKGLTQRIRGLREAKGIAERIDFPEWNLLTPYEQKELLDVGFVIDVNRMGKAILGVSQDARAQRLRDIVASKRQQR